MSKDPWKRLILRAKGNARPGYLKLNGIKRDYFLEVTITPQYLMEQFKRQDGKCYWSGYPLNPNDIFKSRCPWSISLDRLDDSKGYVPGNVVLTTRAENLGRKDTPFDVYQKYIEKRNNYTLNITEPVTLNFDDEL